MHLFPHTRGHVYPFPFVPSVKLRMTSVLHRLMFTRWDDLKFVKLEDWMKTAEAIFVNEKS